MRNRYFRFKTIIPTSTTTIHSSRSSFVLVVSIRDAMSQAGRNFDMGRFSSSLVIIVALLMITWECEAQDNLKCSGGVCVPTYLCAKDSNIVKTDGDQLLDLRFEENECPNNMICCGVDDEPAGKDDLLPEGSCNGECVKESECRTRTEVVDLRLGKNVCGAGRVCCEKQPSKACQGKCVPQSQCSDYNPVQGLINLRFENDGCPANQICCNNVKISETCEGLCLPRVDCANVRIESKYDDNRCPRQLVCCSEPKPSLPTAQVKCEGKCLPASQCPTSAVEGINLRLSNGCPFSEVCCSTALPQCDGTCNTADQCADASRNNTDAVDLRLPTFNCPFDQICCRKLKEVTSSCDGTCVPVQQCPELNTWDSSINLRLSENSCPFKTVCCKNPSLKFMCNGTCVTQGQCTDAMDLRVSHNCPTNKVCCKNVQIETLETPAVQKCNGICVPSMDCPRDTNINAINLRLTYGSCPDNKVCCLIKPTEMFLPPMDECEGTCVPQNQCSEKYQINLRKFGTSCPFKQVCCKVPKISSSCEGTCVTTDMCLDPPLLNLRFSDSNVCTNNQICCKSPRPQEFSCDGQCVPVGTCSATLLNLGSVDLRLMNDSCPKGTQCCPHASTCEGKCAIRDQCDDDFGSQGINLRIKDPNACPANQMCCKKLKLPQTSKSCDGNCVSTAKCPIDLRFNSEQCPFNQVCCKGSSKSNVTEVLPSSVCDGTCVPNWQCSPSDVDLRVNDGQCSANQVCCKTKLPPCPGQCVSPELCEDVGINLRFMQSSCAKNQVCCRNLKPQTCPGQCVPANQCSRRIPGKSLVDLRLTGNGCPSDKVCCMIPNPFQTPLLMPSAPSPSSPSGTSCTLKPESKTGILKKPDVKWLANIWTRQELLGISRRQFVCTGTLLKSDLVLTTADCVKDITPEGMYVRIDDFNLKPLATLSPRREFNVTKIILHPDYSSTDRSANVAVLKLAKNATRSANVCLPNQSKLDPKDLCLLIGWNKLNIMDETILYATPDKSSVSVLTTGAKCEEGYICSDDRKQSTQGQCADAFQGSPLICFAGNGSNWVQMGMVAAGNMGCNEEGVPNSFVSIGAYGSWIQEQIAPSFRQIVTPTDPNRRYLPPVV
ncbi:hypothetical protein RP20_CCG026384 [Aedes albopictus]|nr:hypothetical protein RP20_CCG026384 [Aedes albopictus]